MKGIETGMCREQFIKELEDELEGKIQDLTQLALGSPILSWHGRS